MTARITTPASEWLEAPPLQWLPKKREGRRLHKRTQRVIFGLQSPDGPEFLVLEEGGVTDLESYPRIVRFFFGILGFAPGTSNPIAPVIHDYLYQHRGRVPRYCRNADGEFIQIANAPAFSRREADDLFHWLLVETGTPRWRADIMYKAVKRWGRHGWGS